MNIFNAFFPCTYPALSRSSVWSRASIPFVVKRRSGKENKLKIYCVVWSLALPTQKIQYSQLLPLADTSLLQPPHYWQEPRSWEIRIAEKNSCCKGLSLYYGHQILVPMMSDVGGARGSREAKKQDVFAQYFPREVANQVLIEDRTTGLIIEVRHIEGITSRPAGELLTAGSTGRLHPKEVPF